MGLRQATIGEESLLSELAYRSEAYWGYDQVFMNAFRLRYSVKPEHLSQGRTFVYEEEKKIIGFFTLTEDQGFFELEFFYIDPVFIGNGYGRIMWDQLVLYCRGEGISSFELVTSPQAAEFYTRMGAVIIGEVESYLRQGRKIPKLHYMVL